MCEGEFLRGEQAGLIEKLRRLQVCQATLEHLLRQLGNDLQQGKGHLGTDDRSSLEQALVLRREPVDTGSQHRLHRRWYLDDGQGLGQLIGSRRTDQRSHLH
jgi:hypothetical protein